MKYVSCWQYWLSVDMIHHKFLKQQAMGVACDSGGGYIIAGNGCAFKFDNEDN